MLYKHTIEVDEQPYIVEFISTAKWGDPMGFIDGFRYIAKQTSARKPKVGERWYCYTLHCSIKRKFVLVYPICTEAQYQRDPSLIIPPRIRKNIQQQ